MADVDEVEVKVAHTERATLRVGDMFLKIDADQTRIDAEVAAIARAPIPTAEILWRKPHGDLQVDHIFIDDDEVTGVLDWSEGAPGEMPE